MSKLRLLDISDNQLTMLPRALDRLTDLKLFNSGGNPLISQSSSIEVPSHLLVAQYPGSCGMCGFDPEHISVESIEQLEGRPGWKLYGTGKVMVQCERCAQMFKAVRSEIPIECHVYVCPTCNGRTHLDYVVKKIIPDPADGPRGGGFSFEAEILCRKCKVRSKVVEILRDLLKIKKLEVKVTGISVER